MSAEALTTKQNLTCQISRKKRRGRGRVRDIEREMTEKEEGNLRRRQQLGFS